MTTTERHLANMMLIAGQRWIETGRPEDLATLHRRINQLQHYRDLVNVQVKIEILDMCKMFLYAKRTESSFSLGNPRNAPLNIDRTKNLSAIVSKRQVVGDLTRAARKAHLKATQQFADF